MDETQEYRFDSSVGINTKGPLTKYKPKVVISYPNAAPLSLVGSVDVMNNKQKQSLESVVVLKGIQDDPITINGTLEFEIHSNLLNFTKTAIFGKETHVPIWWPDNISRDAGTANSS